MLARHEGLVVLVAGAIPGERVRARVERMGKGIAHASVVEVVEPSADRRSGEVDWGAAGNDYAHIRYERQLALKAEVLCDALTRISHLEPPGPIVVTPSPERGYRMRARLHVERGAVGFFREGTHQICDPASGGQLLDTTVEIIGRLAGAFTRARLDEVAAVELSENVTATQRVIHIELARRVEPARLAALIGVDGITGITAGGSDDPGGGRAFTIGGDPTVMDTLRVNSPGGGAHQVVFRRHVRSFFQANRHLVERLASRVVELVGEGPIADLYAGVGLFALSLAAAGRGPVVAVEGERYSASDLKANAAVFEGNVETHRMAVEAFLAEAELPEETTLVVDPPRTGMTRAALDSILAQPVARIVYVSCDVATLARDLGRIAGAGYRLSHLEAFDMFPNTGHVEAVAVAER